MGLKCQHAIGDADESEIENNIIIATARFPTSINKYLRRIVAQVLSFVSVINNHWTVQQLYYF